MREPVWIRVPIHAGKPQAFVTNQPKQDDAARMDVVRSGIVELVVVGIQKLGRLRVVRAKALQCKLKFEVARMSAVCSKTCA